MGSVWVAQHLALNTHVAIKFMGASVADDPVSVKRFSREAKAAAQIKSPHVVQIFDHGIAEDGTPYIVMELLEGEGLDKRCRRLGPLNVVEMARIVAQVCKALAKAHEVGIIHRDIKPANIFLIDSGGEPFVKVLDFGVAKFSGEQAVDMTSPGHMVGTPSYMSPEAYFDAKRVSYRSDLWSLGVVAYSTLTGQRPFSGSTLGELCVSIKRAEPVPPTHIRRDLPPGVDAWMARALAREPTDRFTSAREMAEELERAVGLPTAMGSTTSLIATGAHQAATISGASLSRSGTATTVPSPRRTGVVLAVLAGGVLLGGAVGAAALFMTGPTTESATVAAPGTEAPTAESAAPASEEPATSIAPATETPAEPDDGAGGAGQAVEVPEVPLRSPVTPAPRPPHPAVPGKEDERTQRAGDALGI
jgi:serine/threonine-protein kinase